MKEVQKLEAIKMDEAAFQKQISGWVEHADKRAREYKVAINKGNFEAECPYPELIGLFEHIRQLLLDKGWNDQVAIYTQQIRIYHELLEKDNKLREIEAQKALSRKETKELLKIKVDEAQELAKVKRLEEVKTKNMEEFAFNKYISDMVNKAEKKAREYDLVKPEAKFEVECPYPGIIEGYEYIKKLLLDKKWNDQAAIYTQQIRFYQEKSEKDKKLRDIELQKAERDKKYKDLHKIQEIDSIEAVLRSLDKEEELINFEEKKEREIAKSEEIFNMINNAERMEKKYEQEKKKDRILQVDCPYEQIIEIYKEAIKKFESIGWKKESSNIINSIRYYKEKIEKDKILRELALKK